MDKPSGGTELMYEWLISNLPAEVSESVQLVCRPHHYDPNKKNILWIQDMPADMPFITDVKTRKQFAKIVFVSNWQQTVFFLNAGVPYSESLVMHNAIYPIEPVHADDGLIRLVYHPTPHRGLSILVDVFEDLAKEFTNLHLDVFSNFDLYARPESNAPFEPLYERCINHPNITYWGSRPNEEVRQALARADIFAYPSIWRETSCMSAMEAMSAKCVIVHPHYGSLSETIGNFGISYSWTEDQQQHASIFKNKLREAIIGVDRRKFDERLKMQKLYADSFYNKETRLYEWINILTNIDNGISSDRPYRGLTWM